jgi:hypothetical protein
MAGKASANSGYPQTLEMIEASHQPFEVADAVAVVSMKVARGGDHEGGGPPTPHVYTRVLSSAIAGYANAGKVLAK